MKSRRLTQLHADLAEHLEQIQQLFRPGAKVTLVVRNPGYGDAGVVIGDDDLDEAVKEIRKRQEADRCKIQPER